MLKDNPRVIIPNFFTSLNMIIGFVSIYLSIAGDLDRAAWFILLSAIMDKLDGTFARLFKASSEFGVEFDSFSDFVSFGLAPVMLYFFYFLSINNGDINATPLYIKLAVAVFVLFSAMRLAKFNAIGKEDKIYFRGLTTTQAGIMVASFFLVCQKYELTIIQDTNFSSGILLGCAVLLVSPFKYPKIGKHRSKILNIIQTLVLVVLAAFVFVRKMPEAIFLTGALYLVIGVIVTWIKDRSQKGRHEEEVETGD